MKKFSFCFLNFLKKIKKKIFQTHTKNTHKNHTKKFEIFKIIKKNQKNSYLAVVAGLCTEADYIFIPEDPAKVDWPKRICAQLSQARR